MPLLDGEPEDVLTEPAEPTAARAPWGARPQVHGVLFAIVGALWLWALQATDINDIGDYGLLSALHFSFYLALAVLTVGFLVGVRQGASNKLLAPYLALFIAVVHASPVILYGTLRYAWAWKHVGVVDYFMRTHAIDTNLSFLPIYQNWPGFFGISSTLTEAVGLKSALSFAAWAPPVFELLNLAALWIVIGSLTRDRRVRLTACWFFLIGNWVGQDYFAPQAFVFFLYLVSLGVVLRSLSKRPAPPRFVRKLIPSLRTAGAEYEETAPGAAPSSTWGAVAIVSAMFAVVATSHPLTPIVLTASLVGLAIFGVLRVRSLPLIMGAMTVGWLFTGAYSYYSANSTSIFEGFGAFSNNLSSNLMKLGHVEESQKLISQAGRAQVALIAVLAVCGLIRRLAQGKWDAAAGVLLVAPIVILIGGNYDGEALFRVFLFALPFAAFFMATLLYPNRDAGRGWMTTVVAIGLSAVILTGFLFAYYGKESWSYFSKGEIRAASIVYEHAPADTLLVDGTRDYPNQFHDAERFTYVTLATEPTRSIDQIMKNPVGKLAEWLGDPRYREAYLLITKSQKEQIDAIGPLPRGSLAKIEAALLASPRFQVVYHDEDASLFRVHRDDIPRSVR
jgi:hypothetical protein